MAKLTYKQREKLPKGEFAIEERKAYPLDTPNRARNALSRVSQFGTPTEKAEVRREVHKKYPNIEISKKGKQ